MFPSTAERPLPRRGRDRSAVEGGLRRLADGQVRAEVEVRGRVQDAVECLGLAGKHEQVIAFRAGLEDLRERVHQAPGGLAGIDKLLVTGCPPLAQDHPDLRGSDDVRVERLDEQVVHLAVGQLRLAVRGDPAVLEVSHRADLLESFQDERGEVHEDVRGVLATELDLAGEAEIVADEHAGADDHASGEALVVGVAEAEDRGVVAVSLGGDFHHAEVAHSLVREGVDFLADVEAHGVELVADVAKEGRVSDGRVGLGGLRSRGGDDLLAGNLVSAAVSDEVEIGHGLVSLFGVGFGLCWPVHYPYAEPSSFHTQRVTA